MPDLSRIAKDLEEQEVEIRAKLGEIRSQAAELEEDLERISTALKALRSEKSKKRKAAKPAPTQDDVIQHIKSLRSEKPDLDEEELNALVKERLKQEGKSLSGFGIHFPKALKRITPTFVETKSSSGV